MNEMHVINSGSLGILYNLINSWQTHKTSIAPLINSNGSIKADDFKKAELLNEHLLMSALVMMVIELRLYQLDQAGTNLN